MEYKIAVIPGDGIGVDVIREAVRSLDKIGEVYGHQFHKVERLVGGCCIDAYGVPIQPETLELCRECDAILFGAAGGPKWDHLPQAQRPESGLAALCRATVGITAPREDRVLRIMARDGITEDYARLRMAAQPADEYYTAHCSHILENCQESPAEFEAVAEKFFKNLIREVFTYE